LFGLDSTINNQAKNSIDRHVNIKTFEATRKASAKETKPTIAKPNSKNAKPPTANGSKKPPRAPIDQPKSKNVVRVQRKVQSRATERKKNHLRRKPQHQPSRNKETQAVVFSSSRKD